MGTPRFADYLLCGLKVSSALPLPELCERDGRNGKVDVKIRFGRVPERLTGCIGATPFLQVARNGACRMEIPTVASFLINDGREIVVAPASDPTSPDIATFLLGGVLALLCHQRQMVPLHAACVHVGAGPIALAGRSGSGKSALAAALARRGHQLLADDVCVVDLARPTTPCVGPVSRHTALWRDTLDALGINPEGLLPHRLGQQRYRTLPGGSASSAATFQQTVLLRAIYLLDTTSSDEPEHLRPLRGEEAAAALADYVHCRRAPAWMGREQTLLADLSRIADAVPVGRLARRPGLDRLEAVAQWVERLQPGPAAFT